MPEKSRPEFILEAVRIFLWPMIVVLAVLWLGPDLREILKSRTWKIGILEVGDRISNLENTLQDELLLQKDYLNRILLDAADAGKVKEYASKAIASIENAQKGVKKEVQNIQEAIPQGLVREAGQGPPMVGQEEAGEKQPDTARGWETLGFKYLLARQIEPAIEAFSKAEKMWPDYHNVSEIRNLLVQHRGELEQKESPEWKKIYQKVTTQFSWGMPSDVREQMQKSLAG